MRFVTAHNDRGHAGPHGWGDAARADMEAILQLQAQGLSHLPVRCRIRHGVTGIGAEDRRIEGLAEPGGHFLSPQVARAPPDGVSQDAQAIPRVSQPIQCVRDIIVRLSGREECLEETRLALVQQVALQVLRQKVEDLAQPDLQRADPQVGILPILQRLISDN